MPSFFPLLLLPPATSLARAFCTPTASQPPENDYRHLLFISNAGSRVSRGAAVGRRRSPGLPAFSLFLPSVISAFSENRLAALSEGQGEESARRPSSISVFGLPPSKAFFSPSSARCPRESKRGAFSPPPSPPLSTASFAPSTDVLIRRVSGRRQWRPREAALLPSPVPSLIVTIQVEEWRCARRLGCPGGRREAAAGNCRGRSMSCSGRAPPPPSSPLVSFSFFFFLCGAANLLQREDARVWFSCCALSLPHISVFLFFLLLLSSGQARISKKPLLSFIMKTGARQ